MAKFHCICRDLEKSGFQWAGKGRDASEWKILLISAHAHLEGMGSKLVRGLDGELVNIRESSASMSKRRSASLIEFCLAFCAQNRIRLSAREQETFS
jgi:hypothetical protein